MKKGSISKNIYDLSNEYGIGYDSRGREFYFDLEDYILIEKYFWHLSSGYPCTNIERGKTMKMHRLILGLNEAGQEHIHVDHANRIRFDNRKSNLRISNYQTNSLNHKTRKDNSSGISGVQFRDKYKIKKWVADIQFEGKRKHLGYFLTFEEAIIARLQAEAYYFSNFAPQSHLFEQYGIIP